MAGMNSQIHLTIDTVTLNRLQSEAVEMEISVSELIRRKIANPPTDKEVMLLRELLEEIKHGRSKTSKNSIKK
jgi:hypothetical protein